MSWARAIAAAALGLAASPAQAGVWVHDPGSAWLQIGWRHTSASKVFTGSGTKVPMVSPKVAGRQLGALFESGNFTGDELAMYAEVGVVKGLEVYGRLPVRWGRTTWDLPGPTELRQQNVGLGDALVGARAGGTRGPVAMSLRAQVGMPLYDNRPAALNRGAGNSDFYDDRPPLGQGTIDVDLGGGVGVGFGRGWAQLDQTVQLRNRGYSTAFPGTAQLGLRAAPWLAGFGELGWRLTAADGHQPTFFLDQWSKSPLVIDRQHQLAVGGGVIVQPLANREGLEKGLGVSARYDSIVVGRRAAAVRGLGVSLVWSL